MSRKRRRRPIPLASLVLLAAAAALGWAAWTAVGPGPPAASGDATTVILERGSGVNRIAHTLAEAGVVRSPLVFSLAAKLTGAAGALKAGEYRIADRSPLVRILADIRAGRVVRHQVTIPEGWTSEMAAEAVQRSDVLVGPASAPPEGSLLPDTYQVDRGESREAVLARMRAARDKLLAELWAKRQPGLPFRTPEEAVNLASIVEKETAVPAERRRVAAVFVNRLRAGMRLESDPTIIYGITGGRPLGRGIRASELAAATPYNTYQVAGLPPTPIANPGRDSLAAVLSPARSDELFFVADGAGGHAFAVTYEQHEKNVALWRTIERKRAARQSAAQ